jgi:hypothetical protein
MRAKPPRKSLQSYIIKSLTLLLKEELLNYKRSKFLVPSSDNNCLDFDKLMLDLYSY